jgi:glutathione S-transferase
LNYKGISYKTQWAEYSEIEGLCKSIGAAPTMTLPNGMPYYTLPVIKDEATGAVISDSMKIIEYLEAKYPEKPLITPSGTISLYKAVDAAIMGAFGAFPNAPHKHNIGLIYPKLTSDNARQYFKMTRESYFGPIDALVCKGDALEKMMGEVEAGMGKIAGWYKDENTLTFNEDGVTLSLADFMVAGYLMWFKKLWGEETAEWKKFLEWNGGRWGKLLQSLGKYEQVI